MTCGWYGKCSSRCSGPAADGLGQQLTLADPGGHRHEDDLGHRPERPGAAQVQLERPVGRRRPTPGASRSGRVVSSDVPTSVGPSRVRCAGMNRAMGSPAPARRASSWEPHGSGMPTATPIVRTKSDPPPPTRATSGRTSRARAESVGAVCRRQEADPVVHTTAA